MKTYLKHLLTCACLLSGGQASAAGYLYDCSITNKGERIGWLSDKVAFVFPGDGKVEVIDAVILHFDLSPVRAKVSTNSKTKMVMRWSLKGITDVNKLRIPDFDYTARINKSTNSIVLEANPREFSESWVGRGSCVKRTK